MKLLRLSLPFAWVASTLLVFPFRGEMLLWIGAAAVCGLVLTHRLGRIGLGSLILAGGLTGGVTAWFSAYFLPGFWRTEPAAAMLGMIAALPLTPVVGAAEWVRARPRSLLEGVALRCALISASLISIVFVAWARLMELELPHGRAWLAASGFLIAVCATTDAWRLIRLPHWRRDLGVGDPAPTYINEGSPYRSEPRVMSVVLGDLPATRRILMRQVTFDVAALLFALAGISAGLST